MTYGNTIDFGADGREISRPKKGSAKYLLSVANNLLKMKTGRDNELLSLIKDLNENTSSLKGNKYFYNADFMTHHGNGFYASARMYSKRIVNTDNFCNQEGLENHYIADGCNFLMVYPGEYEEIFPVWDWAKIPGTTVELPGNFDGDPRRKGETDFVGGVSDGKNGIAAFDFKRGKLSARKAWFFFENVYVCLGAGISTKNTKQVITTVNQCYFKGEIKIDGKTISNKIFRFKTPAEIYHNKVTYIFPATNNVTICGKEQSGSWKKINADCSGEKITKNVFSLWINHGTSPKNEKYSYIVCPNSSTKYSNEIEIISNNSDFQAVENKKLKLIEMAIYNAGKYALGKDLSVEVNIPCILIIQEIGKELKVYGSDPTQKHNKIKVKISGRLQKEITIKLSSVTKQKKE